MSILLTCPQGVLMSALSLLLLVHCVTSFRRLKRSFTTWRDALTLSRLVVLLGVTAFSLAILDVRGSGLLTVLAYHRDQPAIRDVFAGLRSEPVSKARGAALLKEVGGFGTVSRPTLAPAPPSVTEALRAGTPLDKALWLLARLDNSKARLVAADTRAWVESPDTRGVVWIFDPAYPQPWLKVSLEGQQYLAHRVWSGESFANGAARPHTVRETRLAAIVKPD